MSLAIDYCREIARELRQTAVYIPGSAVKPGDILRFDHANLLGVPKPLGEFVIYGNLSDLDVHLETVSEEETLDSYIYASKGSVNVSFETGVEAGDIGEGKLSIGFTKSGATYFSALDCAETRFKSIIGLEEKLAPHQNSLNWKDFFLVISVTTAKKALIMQSNTSTATLEIAGDIKNFAPSGLIRKDLDVNMALNISKYKEASFIKDWSDNVPVFFNLVRFKKKFETPVAHSGRKRSPLAADLIARSNDLEPYVIETVYPPDLL